VLLALALPPTAPWWLGLTGIVFAIVIGKHLFGGLGHNLFNPAMAGYAALMIAFPVAMTRWLLPEGVSQDLPSFTAALDIFLDRELLEGIDVYTGATALDKFRQHEGAQLVSEFWQKSPLMGEWSGRGWEWINGGFLFGGLYLLYKRIISWHIPCAFLAALALLAALFYDSGSSQSPGSPLMHLFAGATMLGALFIATDPVTAATTLRGKLIYGATIGSLVFIIRAFGNYPDGVAFAVLLGNVAAPLIDVMTAPRRTGTLS
jgi:electron transport complex protein RnfD